MNRQFIHAELATNVTPAQQVALARIAEEAAEIVKEAMKALRFGTQNRHPEGGPTNAEKIVAEYIDLRTALIDAALLPPENDVRELLARIIAAHHDGVPSKDANDDRIFMDGSWLNDAEELLRYMGAPR